MPSTTVYNMAGEAVEKLELSEQVFGVTPNVAVLHQVVTAQLVNRRQGNASTKTRSEVSGGGKKPYKQKQLQRKMKKINKSRNYSRCSKIGSVAQGRSLVLSECCAKWRCKKALLRRVWNLV